MSTSRMRENLEAVDVELGPDEMAELNGLDQGESGRGGPDPDSFDWIPG